MRIWSPKPIKNQGKITGYQCRWFLADEPKPRTETFKTARAAQNHNAMLTAALNKGEPFAIVTGLPLTHPDTVKALTPPSVEVLGPVELATRFADRKWEGAAPNYRVDIAKVMTAFTVAMLTEAPPATFAGAPLRAALCNGQFVQPHREGMSQQDSDIVAWVRIKCRPMRDLEDQTVFEDVLAKVMRKVDGTPRADSSYKRYRAILGNFLNYSVRAKQLDSNPFDNQEAPDSQAYRPVKNIVAVDRRRLPTGQTAEDLLAAIGEHSRSTSVRLAMEIMYRAGLRPEEVVGLKVEDFIAPAIESGFGELVFAEAEPETNKRFTDTGTRRHRRQLKHRAEHESRRVPVHPLLAAGIVAHIKDGKLKPGQYLLTGQRGDRLAYSVLNKALKKARERALSAEQATSNLAQTLYDWRHLCLTNWLNAGVPPATVAQWAGNSVPVLLSTYINTITNEEVLRGLLLGMYGEPETAKADRIGP